MGFGEMPSGKISHEEAGQAQEKFIAETRQKVQYWEGVISEHKSQLESYRSKNDQEGIRGMEKLISEAEVEKAKEESKIMSKI